MLSATEKLKIAMKRSGVTVTSLATLTGQTRQNLAVKLARDDLLESQIAQLADALGYTVEINLIERKTGNKI